MQTPDSKVVGSPCALVCAPMLILGDCLERLRCLEADSLDSLVTDPPAGFGFCGIEKEAEHFETAGRRIGGSAC